MHERKAAIARFPITTNALKARRRAFVLWSIAYAAVLALYSGMYPFVETVDMGAMVKNLPKGFSRALGYDKIGTAAGYLSSSVFGLIGPVLLNVFGIGLGARLVAGQEEDGTLELELAGPVARERIYGQRLAALLVSVTGLVSVGFATLCVVTAVAGLDVALHRIALMCVSLWLLGGALGSVSFALGAATGRRAVALAGGAALGVVSFMLNAIGPTIGHEWMTAVSPWSWYIADSPLLGETNWVSMALLAALVVAAAAAGRVSFKARDLMV